MSFSIGLYKRRIFQLRLPNNLHISFHQHTVLTVLRAAERLVDIYQSLLTHRGVDHGTTLIIIAEDSVLNISGDLVILQSFMVGIY